MKASRLVAVALVAGAAAWIASGHFLPHEKDQSRAESQGGAREVKKPFRVAVLATSVVEHGRRLLISGRTEAERRVTVTARTGGVLTELRVRRGSAVNAGDVLAVLSDEAREAQVLQAKSLLQQRRTEFDAKQPLVASGAIPRLEGVNLEAQLRAAQAAVAAAEAERDRGVIRAPWAGVVSDVAVEVGKAAFSFAGADVLTLVAPDPMLAVVEVAERRLAGIKPGEIAQVRLVTGDTVSGRVRFAARTASPTTRTYRVEIELANADFRIPDGITAEVSVPLALVPASRVPRSALTFSSTGELGVRSVDADDRVRFIPVSVVEDDQSFMWLSGIPGGSRVIVQGQDFVREGQLVEAVMGAELTATAH